MKLKEMKKYTKPTKKIKVGIAFGGGGTRGFAHLGALKAFEEEGIYFDEVAGTSVGSVVGALYAYGLTADEMIEIGKTIKPKSIRGKFLFSDTTGIQDLVKQSIGDILIEELKLPFTAVAVDIKSGKEVNTTYNEEEETIYIGGDGGYSDLTEEERNQITKNKNDIEKIKEKLGITD